MGPLLCILIAACIAGWLIEKAPEMNNLPDN